MLQLKKAGMALLYLFSWLLRGPLTVLFTGMEELLSLVGAQWYQGENLELAVYWTYAYDWGYPGFGSTSKNILDGWDSCSF